MSMREVRDGYFDPAGATTQAEKYGASVRRSDELKAQARAQPVASPTPPAPISFSNGPGYVRTSGARVSAPRARATASGTARAVAILIALLAAGYAHSIHLNWVYLGIYAVLGAFAGYVVGWLLFWAVVVTGVVLKWAIRIAVFCFAAYIGLALMGVIR